jgi:phosphoglycerate dehydrogenase-like enzyme
VLIWVPADWVANVMTGLPGTRVEVVDMTASLRGPALAAADGDGGHGASGPGSGGGLPQSVAEVEFYVPPFFGSEGAARVMARMPRLRVVQALTAGVDRLRPHVPAGAVLCNARGAHDAVTAEWVVGAMIGAQREFPFFAREQAAGRWSYQRTAELAEKTVLIVGYGSIGAAVERRLAGFEVSVVRVARRARPADSVLGLDDLPGVLPAADVVVLLVPFTAETAGMADAAFLARMKDGSLLVNAARGAVVVTSALMSEVSSGRLRAALDVTDPEPLPAGHPLWTMPGAFITPHTGASTPVSLRRAAELAREQAAAFLRGEPLRNVITGAY